jgi:hypothetical protein
VPVRDRVLGPRQEPDEVPLVAAEEGVRLPEADHQLARVRQQLVSEHEHCKGSVDEENGCVRRDASRDRGLERSRAWARGLWHCGRRDRLGPQLLRVGLFYSWIARGI